MRPPGLSLRGEAGERLAVRRRYARARRASRSGRRLRSRDARQLRQRRVHHRRGRAAGWRCPAPPRRPRSRRPCRSAPSIGRLWPVPQPTSRIARLVGQADPPLDQVAKDVAPRPIPPVTLVELGHPVVDDRAPSAEHPLPVEREGDQRGHEHHRDDRPPGRPVEAARSAADAQAVEAEADQRDDEEARRCAAPALSRLPWPRKLTAAVQDIAERHRDEHSRAGWRAAARRREGRRHPIDADAEHGDEAADQAEPDELAEQRLESRRDAPCSASPPPPACPLADSD